MAGREEEHFLNTFTTTKNFFEKKRNRRREERRNKRELRKERDEKETKQRNGEKYERKKFWPQNWKPKKKMLVLLEPSGKKKIALPLFYFRSPKSPLFFFCFFFLCHCDWHQVEWLMKPDSQKRACTIDPFNLLLLFQKKIIFFFFKNWSNSLVFERFFPRRKGEGSGVFVFSTLHSFWVLI